MVPQDGLALLVLSVGHSLAFAASASVVVLPADVAGEALVEAAGLRQRQQFWAAVATSAPQPIGALIAFSPVKQIESLLPALPAWPSCR